MTRELITSWSDYRAAADRLLALASEKIAVYDEDLVELRLESAAALEQLQRIVKGGQGVALRLAVRNAAPLAQRQPGLLKLLTVFGHRALAQQTPEQLAHLRDNLLIVDDRHALIRFDREQARGKLLIDEADEVRPYARRFEEIWAEGGERFTATTLGL